MVKHEDDGEYIIVYPKDKRYQIVIDEEKGTICYGKRQEDREDLVIMTIEVIEKGLEVKSLAGKMRIWYDGSKVMLDVDW